MLLFGKSNCKLNKYQALFDIPATNAGLASIVS